MSNAESKFANMLDGRLAVPEKTARAWGEISRFVINNKQKLQNAESVEDAISIFGAPRSQSRFAAILMMMHAHRITLGGHSVVVEGRNQDIVRVDYSTRKPLSGSETKAGGSDGE